MMRYFIGLIVCYSLYGCGTIPLFYDTDLKELEIKLITDNKLIESNLIMSNCKVAATTLDDKKYLPLLSESKYAIFYLGVCGLEKNTKVIYFEPSAEYVKYFRAKNLVKTIYPNWFSEYGKTELPNFLMSKVPGGQLHLIGQYLYVIVMPRTKISEYENILKELNKANIVPRRNVVPWTGMDITISNVK